MNTKVNFRRQMKVEVEVMYFNCRECGVPLMTVKCRKAGTCGGHAKGIDQRKFNDAETARRKSSAERKGAGMGALSVKRSKKEDDIQRRIDALVERVRGGGADDGGAGYDVAAAAPGRLSKLGRVSCVKVG